MTRPRIVRADTLDLQDHDAPSAKDHSKPQVQPTGLAPHQEKTLRHADQDSKAEIMHGPSADDDAEYGDGIDIYDDDDEIEDIDELGHHHRRGDLGGSEEGDLADGEGDDMLDDDDDDMMDKISSSPSIDDEDIDFEFVYALHNFVATVDGQANAAKGDTMVLLDDSNSYWWLVRIVKDGSIGYLPAEHIETPTERLARLNKHRNVDLSATMLGDNSEKSKNPLKKAMRRRNAKTVTFTSPTYIEASDVDYSTDEELDDDVSFNDEDIAREDAEHLQDQNDDIVVEPLRPKSRERSSEDDSSYEAEEPDSATSDKQRSSQEIFEAEVDNAVSRSRNGTVRNTDSFFKDDTVETKKISLTPNLLRDEVGGGAISSEAKEGHGSLDAIDKTLSAIDKEKKDKGRKDKKPGMLSGLFKRKDKKTRTNEDDTEDAEKNSTEISRASPQPKTSMDSVSSPESARSPKPLVVQRQSSKLQKQPPPVVMSPTKQAFLQEPVSSPDSKESKPVTSSKADQTIRQVTSEEADDIPSSPPLGAFDENQEALSSPARVTSPSKKSTPAKSEPVDEYSPIESQRDWQDASEGVTYPQRSLASPPQRFQPKPAANYQQHRLDSPLSVSPVDGPVYPVVPALVAGLPSPGRHSVSSVSPPLSPTTSARDSRGIDAAPVSYETASVGTPTWSDASLRSYLDDENDIRDLFLIVHDNSNIPPAGPDHPITGSLFKEESKRLREMTSQLDTMLADWVGRRMRTSASK
ncbi:SH3 domain protein [Aspergillus ellipticus CBS 707.79]|uniref:SH3 domain protein n=1 Tax=Aspergillus ellipticus CBS 707.79 TaxID=1448320 RepID=A0A319DP77_9EURO|nr:SH3 domain protein [Aspergillus ellipticus CBS 707.79]